ncbi:MAG: protein kinase [Gammaproteobacteria bacterium]|nr:protein kinase [Gammaproteobacteria bacterium]
MTNKVINNQNQMVDADEIEIFISGIKIFFDIDYDVISEIAKKIKHVTFKKGEFLTRQGHSDKLMYIIWDGEIKIKLPDKEITRFKGEIIGEISMLTGNPYCVDVVAQTQVKAFSLDYYIFQELITTNRQVAKACTALMVSRLDILRKQGAFYLKKYQVFNKMGEGSMAIVYEGYDPELKREVAIKMLKYEVAVNNDILNRFRQEAITIAQLDHPNIIKIYDIIEDYATIFIVMEKVDGQNLGELLKQKGFFFPNEVQAILSQVAEALSYTHAKGDGVIHRDIKPSNMLVDKSSKIKLMDFGLAGPPSSYPSQIEGTVNYIAPELILGQAIDGRVDIYALGITAYKLLTGELPFHSPDSKELLKMHVNEELPDLKEKYPHIPNNLVEFINKALVKDPLYRIASWDKIIELLNPGQSENNLLSEQGVLLDLCLNINVHKISEKRVMSLVKSIKRVLQKDNLDFSISTSEIKSIFQSTAKTK